MRVSLWTKMPPLFAYISWYSRRIRFMQYGAIFLFFSCVFLLVFCRIFFLKEQNSWSQDVLIESLSGCIVFSCSFSFFHLLISHVSYPACIFIGCYGLEICVCVSGFYLSIANCNSKFFWFSVVSCGLSFILWMVLHYRSEKNRKRKVSICQLDLCKPCIVR